MKILTSFLLFFTTVFVFGQNNLQDLFNQYKDSIPNYGIVGLVDYGDRKEEAIIGFTSEKMPIKMDSRFCIGSVSKMFTSVLVMKLQDAEKLNVDDSIGTYLPTHKFIDPNIKISQLLNHTSGIKDVVTAELANKTFLEPDFDFSETYLLSLIDTIDFEKGKKYKYSNSNFMLLKMIVEKVSDKPFEMVLMENIIIPLNMKNTFAYYSSGIEKLAHPIVGKQDFQEYSKFALNHVSKGVGNVVSDAQDVNVFLRALFIDQTLLSEESFIQMTNFTKFNKHSVGLGVFQENYNERNVMGHSGRTISYVTYAYVDPKTNTSFVLLVNNANDPYIDLLIEDVCKTMK